MTEDASIKPYPVSRTMQTRWSDNDQNSHLNNAVYYELLDTVINGWLAEAAGVGNDDPIIPVVVESRCRFLAELAFPAPIRAGLRVAKIGRSSVTYELALFTPDDRLAAEATWTHVYIDRETRASTAIPDAIRAALEATTEPATEAATDRSPL
jgi:acyl-CoA thioester hydrolase